MSRAADAVAVIGVGESAYSWASGVSETDLALTAIRAALADAGLAPAQLDGLARFSLDTARPAELARRLGIRDLRVALDSSAGAASATAVLAAAAAAVQSGAARAVACFRAFNGRSGMRLGHLPLPPTTPEGHVLAAGDLPFGGEFTGPYGVVSPACLFPLWVRAYMERYAIDEPRLGAALGEIVVRQRRYAQASPRALLRDRPLGLEDYRASPIVAEPLRRADFCLETDGACAFIVAGRELWSRRQVRPVFVLGTAHALSLEYDNFFLDSPELPPQPTDRGLLARLLERNGLRHADVDVLGLYDAHSANILFDLETFGFCADGAAVDFVHAGRPAINTSGGMLAEVYLQGMNQLVEVVRQLRGDAAQQLRDAQLGVAGVAGAQGVALLSAEVPA
ncbi:MAG: lipid-transfer protein [Gammaproteobacteria bacterium]|nr:lipid-transfer protein [Gammaproteobacteria bacterium]